MGKVILSGYIDVPAADLNDVTGELPNHIRLTREEDGCIVFEVTQDAAITGRFNVYEEFSSEETFSLHQQRVDRSHWGKITARVVRNYAITKGE